MASTAEEKPKEKGLITLFNIGTKFGVLTNGLMTPYYQVEKYKAYSQKDVQSLADEGWTIEIKPASQQEMNWSFKELGKYHYNNS
jgi:hypothetical protein